MASPRHSPRQREGLPELRYLTFSLLRSRYASGQATESNKKKGPFDYAQDWPKAPPAKE